MACLESMSVTLVRARPVDTSDRLAKIALFYHREAERCADNGAYFAACVLSAAALEALLLSMCYVEDRAVRRTLIYKQKRFRSRAKQIFRVQVVSSDQHRR